MTTTYTDYKFTTNGVNLVSRIYSHSPFADTLSKMHPAIIADMNAQAIEQLVGNLSLFTHEELLEELGRINEDGSHAFILLDEGNN